MESLVVQLLNRVWEEMAVQSNDITGIPTGFTDSMHDRRFLQPGDLIVAGAAQMGKTAFAINIAEHVAMNGGRPWRCFPWKWGCPTGGACGRFDWTFEPNQLRTCVCATTNGRACLKPWNGCATCRC